MKNKRKLYCAAVATFSCACALVASAGTFNWVGSTDATDGTAMDVASNWNPAQVPAASDSVVFESCLQDSFLLTANGDLQWNAASFKNAQPILIDVAGHSLSVVTNSAGKNGTATIAAGAEVTLTNGEYSISAFSADFGAGAVLRIAKDAEVTTTSIKMKNDNCRMIVDGGRLNITNAASNIFFDNGTKYTGSRFEICNGGQVFAHGRAVLNLTGTGNTVSVCDGGVYDVHQVNEYNFGNRIDGTNNTFSVSNSTAVLYTLWFGKAGSSVRNRFIVHDSNFSLIKPEYVDFLSRGINFLSGASVSNRIEISGNIGDSVIPDVKMEGSYDTFSLSVPDQIVSIGTVSMNGMNNVFRFESGMMTKFPTFAAAGRNAMFDVCGGAITNANISISGTSGTIQIRDGGSLTYWNGGTLKDRFNFKQYSTNMVLRIAEGGTVSVIGTINYSGNESPTYNWTNCPNCAIEFCGKNPLMEFRGYANNYQVLALGTADDKPLTDPVKLRFIVPLSNYDAAPIQNTGTRDVYLHGNQPIEVALDGARFPEQQMVVPLFYDKQGFRKTEMTDAHIAKLNANATLPDGAKLFYDAANKTLCCRIPGTGATIVIIR